MLIPLGTPPSHSPLSRHGPSEDVFGFSISKYVLGGPVAGQGRVGRGVVPTGISAGRPGPALENPLFSRKISLSRGKCSKMAKMPKKKHDFFNMSNPKISQELDGGSGVCFLLDNVHF